MKSNFSKESFYSWDKCKFYWRRCAAAVHYLLSELFLKSQLAYAWFARAANMKLAKLFDFQTLKKKYFHWTNIIAVRMSDSDGDDDREERLNFKKKRLHFGSLEVQERAKLESGTKVCLSVISVFCHFTQSNLVKHTLLNIILLEPCHITGGGKGAG